MAKLIQNVLPTDIIIEKNGAQQRQIMILTKNLVFAKRHAFKMVKNTKKGRFCNLIFKLMLSSHVGD